MNSRSHLMFPESNVSLKVDAVNRAMEMRESDDRDDLHCMDIIWWNEEDDSVKQSQSFLHHLMFSLIANHKKCCCYSSDVSDNVWLLHTNMRFSLPYFYDLSKTRILIKVWPQLFFWTIFQIWHLQSKSSMTQRWPPPPADHHLEARRAPPSVRIIRSGVDRCDVCLFQLSVKISHKRWCVRDQFQFVLSTFSAILVEAFLQSFPRP